VTLAGERAKTPDPCMHALQAVAATHRAAEVVVVWHHPRSDLFESNRSPQEDEGGTLLLVQASFFCWFFVGVLTLHRAELEHVRSYVLVLQYLYFVESASRILRPWHGSCRLTVSPTSCFLLRLLLQVGVMYISRSWL
jgi:hypothetical protein